MYKHIPPTPIWKLLCDYSILQWMTIVQTTLGSHLVSVCSESRLWGKWLLEGQNLQMSHLRLLDEVYWGSVFQLSVGGRCWQRCGRWRGYPKKGKLDYDIKLKIESYTSSDTFNFEAIKQRRNFQRKGI